jgi:hypothetical protein
MGSLHRNVSTGNPKCFGNLGGIIPRVFPQPGEKYTVARNINLPTGATRTSEVGLVYREVLSGAAGTIEIPKHSAVRVRATASTTITVDGMLVATLISGEIFLFNTGKGSTQDAKETVTVVFSGTVFAQVGKEIE